MDSNLQALYTKPVTSHPAYPGLAVFEREVRRFFSVPVQTLAAPIGSSLLYFTIFHFSIGRFAMQANTAGSLSHGIDYVSFLIPGIMAMEIVNASFQNPVSSLLISKWSGTIVDQLLAPLSDVAMWLAYIAGALVRSVLVAAAAYFAGVVFAQQVPMENFLQLVLALFITTTIFGSLGIWAGVICKSFDQVGMIGTFILQPLVFLSGVFFSLQSFPESIRWLPRVNPVFYVVNMFRNAIVGVGDVNFTVAAGVSSIFALILAGFAFSSLRQGKGLRN